MTASNFEGRRHDAPSTNSAYLHTLGRLTLAQIARIAILKGDPADFHPAFDLPAGYVAGWANGVYYGIDADGQASS